MVPLWICAWAETVRSATKAALLTMLEMFIAEMNEVMMLFMTCVFVTRGIERSP